MNRVGDGFGKASGDFFDMQHVDEKARELMGLFGEALGLGCEVGLVCEQIGVVAGEHASAGAARDNDVIAIRKRLDRLPRQGFGRESVARVIGGLAAAGLARNDDPAAGVLEELDGGEADGRPDDIDETGDEQPDARLFPRAAVAAASIVPALAHFLLDL